MTNRNETRRWRGWHLVAAAALALTAGACGGDGPTETCPAGTTGSPPNCRDITPPCAQSQLFQTPVMVPARWLIYEDFSVTQDGRLDVTLDWTNPENVMGFYLVPVGTCTLEEFNERTCEFLIRGEPAGQKPRRLLAQVNAGNYRWMVGNPQDVDESASLQIVLSTGDCPLPGAAAGPTGSGQDAPTTTTTAPLEGIRRR